MQTRHRPPTWHVATVVETRPETPNAVRLILDVPTWPGSEAGTHLDVRLTAPDGYQATRSYSLATSEPGRIVLGINELPDGEVSPFLVREVRAGDKLEIHGPLGSYFLWRPGSSNRPVQLIAGGSGVVPLHAIATAHAAASDPSLFRLLYSVRTPAHVYFRDELAALVRPSFTVDYVYTRQAPQGWAGTVGRLTRDSLASMTTAPHERARIFVCGSTGFVETIAAWLLELGHSARDILTERFGGL
ncbi:FAD-binding oxidoreductase [Plantactinospora sp. ZYX-F-223]|uniref:FAD-binding oxidoreductase n=1 Tax=Plantactinospora sp. ZYX-F-223 TaxID=3144103 RepID=UPI0031FC3834